MGELHKNHGDPNAFLHVLATMIADGGRQAGSLVGLLIVHIENFDRLASGFGHRAANQVVMTVAKRLVSGLRERDRVVRMGEAKFAIVIDAPRSDGILLLAANKISKLCAQSVVVNEQELTVGSRIGIAVGSGDRAKAEDLLRGAETALLAAASNDVSHSVFEPTQLESMSNSLHLELELDAAIKGREFELYYQPKVSTLGFEPCGAEALIRWNNPKRGYVSPEVFIPLADQVGRIEPLTTFVLNTALRQASEWNVDFPVSVNVAPRLLLSTELVELIDSALKMWDANPARLVIEVTEGALMTDPATSFAVLSRLRELGVGISIDDFGTGYSSLAYFKNIPADELKIDKSFVLNMLNDEGDRRIVKAIVNLTKEFGLKVTAEGVEDEQTARALAALECDSLQGYHYSRPLPQGEFTAWLERARRRVARRVSGG
ncbi:MAG TPA: bifunctional diguanylate cyclase/phosphodiesterase [Gammaproteobacteria bacterium]|nr:bifunctional diguanylate cyclase/phosphodiesterase [Gammaproteobacteria bacterium]